MPKKNIVSFQACFLGFWSVEVMARHKVNKTCAEKINDLHLKVQFLIKNKKKERSEPKRRSMGLVFQGKLWLE